MPTSGKELVTEAVKPQKTFSWRKYNLVAVLVFLVLIFGIANPNFFSVTNLQNVAMQMSVLALVSFAELFPVISGGIDLSVGTTIGLVSVVTAQIMILHGIPAGIIAGLIVGAMVGLFNGVAITRLTISPLIVTLGTLSIAEGSALLYSHGIPITGLPARFSFYGSGFIGPIPFAFLVTAVIYVAVHLILKGTQFGLYTRALGGNEQAVRLSGIAVNKYKILTYVTCGFLVAVGSIILTGQVMSGQPVMGDFYLMQCVAVVFVGGARYGGGEGTATGTLLGALIISILGNGLNLTNISSFIQEVVIGLVVITAVAYDYYQSKQEMRP